MASDQQLSGGLMLARLVFLLVEHQIKIPKIVVRHLPGGKWLKNLHKGIGSSDILMDQAGVLYEEGKSLGTGSIDEAVSIMVRLMNETLSDGNVPPEDLIAVYSALDRMKGEVLVDYEEFSLHEPITDAESITKWDSGFTPLDIVTGGLYQGIIVLMADPGVGKTTVLATIMEEVVKNDAASAVHYYQTEIPSRMMKGRFAPLTQRTKFREDDRILCGGYTPEDIIERLEEDPDPDRLILFDSPDVTAGGDGDGRRFGLETAYRSLIKVKQICKGVIVTTWPRRKDRVFTIRSVSEAWAKAWYADMILGMNSVGANRLRLSVLKNRFGPFGGAINFEYDMENINWSLDDMDLEDDDW